MTNFQKHHYGIEAEDILIFGLCKNFALKGRPVGRYVDIGAFHPIQYSNTYLLYENGWSGVCVEPNPDLADQFVIARPRDIIINRAIAHDSDTVNYHQFDDALLNGIFPESLVIKHVENGKNTLELGALTVSAPKNF